MKKAKSLLFVLLAVCFAMSLALIAPGEVRAADSDTHTIVLNSMQNSDGSYSHSVLYDGEEVTEYDYTWHADPSTVHSDVKNSPAEYYTGTQPGDEAVYIAHDIYYYPELDTSGFTKTTYDGEQEWVYYYTASGYTGYIFSTLPVLGSSLPTDMMHSAEDAYENAVLHITQPGSYVIEGNWHGQIWVDLENYCDDPFTDPTAKVDLILNGVDIECTVAAGVVFKNVYECDNTWEEQSSWSHNVDTSEAGAVVTLADGTVNNVSGTNIFRILKTQYKSGSTSVQKKRLKIDGAFYSYQSLNIEGGTKGTGVLNITSGFEGMNSELHLTINGGNVYINSQDDGINVNEDNVSVLTINGGNLHILAGLGREGDGIDSNGFITVNGGTTISMANPGADSGMDSDFGTYVFGGNVVALGSTMDWAENDSSVSYTHATMNLQFSSSKSAGDSIVITDTSGNGVFAYDPDKDEVTGAKTRTYTGAIVSCDAFEIGQSYYVYIGGDVTGTETMGVYDMTTVTAVSNTYQQSYGSSSSSGSGGGRPPMGGSSSSGSSTNITFTFTNNVNKFSSVKNYSGATTISVTPQEATGCAHSFTSEVTTQATCTTNGVKTYTCTICGYTDTENIPAGGHDYESVVTAPTFNTDGYTTHTCLNCGDEYVDTIVPAIGFTLAGANTKLGSVLDMNFFIDPADLNGTDYYAEITLYAENGPVTTTVPYADWEVRTDYLVVTQKGLAARQMADQIDVVIYNGDGTQASYLWTDSIRSYAMRILEDQSDEGKTLIVDMLNYGAAAQSVFNYNTSDFANNQLSETQQGYATKSVTCEDQRVKGEGYYGSTLTLKDRIMLNVYFSNITPDMYAVVSFTDHKGNAHETRVEGSAFSKYNDSVYGVVVDELVVADGDQLVTVTVYDAEGNAVASASDAVNSYVARQMGGDPIYEMVAKFTTAAYAYFH